MMNTVLALLLLLQAQQQRGPGVVTGQLQTKEGMPAAAIRISAVPAPPPNIRPSDGQNYYATDFNRVASTSLTDAQGRYRLANLAPGRYFIIASLFGYPTFYPGTTNADSGTVVTISGDAPAASGINFTIIMPPGGRVSGRVSTPPAAGSQETAVLSGVALGELLETPVGADGSFTFGHLPTGSYLLSLLPTPPGMPSRPFQVSTTDTRLDLVRPVVHRVTGRFVGPKNVVSRVLIGFATEKSYVTATVNPDGTFSALLQSATHMIELGGLPPAFSLGTARLGSRDVSKGLAIAGQDVSGLEITVSERR
jgi:hypothetical protein